MTTKIIGNDDAHGERLLNMIEALLRTCGAEVRIGPRRVHVVCKDADGLVKLAIRRPDWDAYAASGRIQPRRIRNGLD